MKLLIPSTIVALAALLLPTISWADSNIALAPSGTILFGYNNSGNPATLGMLYDHAGSSTSLNDGSVTGSGDDTFGQSNPSLAFVGATFSTALQVNSVNYYGRLFSDGGWFGINGTSADGGAPADGSNVLSASDLIAPTLQYTTNGGASWIDASDANDYVSVFTGLTVGGGAPTPEVTFTLSTPLIGIDGIRLIGETGGYASGGGGFLGADEFQVEASPIAAPEPSTYVLMLAGGLTLSFYRFRRSRI